jgi:NitT/TauT family transport system substrate-binding protein
VTALYDGTVDASLYWDYEIEGTWRSLGYDPKILPLPDAVEGTFSSCMAFNPDFLAEHRDLAIGYARAVAKSVAFAEENPEAAVQLFWQLVPESKPADVSEEEAMAKALYILEARLKNYSIWPEDPDQRWGAWATEQWSKYLAFLGLSEDLPVESIYTMELIDEINNFDEEAVREMARQYQVED